MYLFIGLIVIILNHNEILKNNININFLNKKYFMMSKKYN